MGPSKVIEDYSYDELTPIFSFLRSLEKPGVRNNILLGGWAVYSYNPYFKSTDIDILANRKTEERLIRHLTKHNSYVYRQLEDDGPKKLQKVFDCGKVIVDIIYPDECYPYQDKSDGLKFSFILERAEYSFLGGLDIPVPEITALLVTKMKAAWDRRARLQRYDCPNRGFEEGKIIKDYSDIIALIDNKHRGNKLDISYLSDMLTKYRFLESVLDECQRSQDAAQKYRHPIKETEFIVQGLRNQLHQSR
jgi:hypothetical protein